MQPNGNGVPKLQIFSHARSSASLEARPSFPVWRLLRASIQGSGQNLLRGTEIDRMRGSKKHASATSVIIIIAAGRDGAEVRRSDGRSATVRAGAQPPKYQSSNRV